MKIKEVERLTGVTAKNIRFYEEQGLLSPARNEENRYRVYDESDIRVLKIIKILRKLDIPMNTVKKVLAQEIPLGEALEVQTVRLKESIEELQTAKEFCQNLSRTETDIIGLDVDNTLLRMEGMEAQGVKFANIFTDFKLAVKWAEQVKIVITPDNIIESPQDFTKALCDYAKEQKKEFKIIKEAMYPVFFFDGIEYNGTRIHSKYGPFIICEAVHPEELLPHGSTSGRIHQLAKFWWIGFPALIVLIMLMSFILR